jgi:hypothetical protein
MTTTPFEHAEAVRAALAAIVSDPAHGPGALDSAPMTANLLQDLLPDAPRESGLLVAAASAGLPAKLRADVAQGMDAATAVGLAAAALASRTAFTPTACAWAATELAIALGLAPPASPAVVPDLAEAQPEPASSPPDAPRTVGVTADPRAQRTTLVQPTLAAPTGRDVGARRPRKLALIALAGLAVVAAAAGGGYGVAALTSGKGAHAAASRPPATVGSRPVTGGTASQPAGPTASQPGTRGPDRIWIAQLASVPISAGAARLGKVVSEVGLDVPNVRVLNSTGYASLNPGYWVVYYAGPFANGVQALAFCAENNRPTRNECIGRFLSHSAADHQDQCYPPATSPTGICYAATREPG